MLRLRPTTLQLTQQDVLEMEEQIDNQIRINKQKAQLECASAQTAVFSAKESAPNSGMLFGMGSEPDRKRLFPASAELPQHSEKIFSGTNSNSKYSNARAEGSLQLHYERIQRSGPSHSSSVSSASSARSPTQETEPRVSARTDNQVDFITARNDTSERFQ